MENIEKVENNSELQNQVYIGEEKNKAIAHKDISLKRLDESFNKHIELHEYKKSNILSYWIRDFAYYHDNEKTFNSNTLKVFKRGDIIKVNLGFNIGNEMGGLHYCVVMNKYDNKNSGILNIIPLSSSKESKIYNSKTSIDLGDELYNLLFEKYTSELLSVTNEISKLYQLPTEERVSQLRYISRKSDYLEKINDEITRMKHGSIACVNQMTAISKQRIFKTPILSSIRLSSKSLDLLDEKIKKLFTK